MCLSTRQHDFYTAEKDIVCWKILLKVRNAQENTFGVRKEEYITPYAYETVDQLILKGKKLFLPRTKHADALAERMDNVRRMPGLYTNNGRIDIERGVIHTYGEISPEVMTELLTMWQSDIGGDRFMCNGRKEVLEVSLWKCVIPKGTEYLKGKVVYYDIHSYGSKALRFMEKIAEITSRCGFPHGIQGKIRMAMENAYNQNI